MKISAEVRFAVVPEWVLCHPELSPTAVRVYCVLSRVASSDGASWYSQPKLASQAHISVATLKRALRELKDVGAVLIHARWGDEGEQRSNLYVVKSSPPRSEVSQGVMDEPIPPVTDEPPPPVTTDLQNDRTIERKNGSLLPAARSDPLWDALEAEFGPAPRNKNLRGGWNVACAELRAKGKPPGWVGARRRAALMSDSPWAAATPMALAKHADLPLNGKVRDPAARTIAMARQLEGGRDTG